LAGCWWRVDASLVLVPLGGARLVDAKWSGLHLRAMNGSAQCWKEHDALGRRRQAVTTSELFPHSMPPPSRATPVSGTWCKKSLQHFAQRRDPLAMPGSPPEPLSNSEKLKRFLTPRERQMKTEEPVGEFPLEGLASLVQARRGTKQGSRGAAGERVAQHLCATGRGPRRDTTENSSQGKNCFLCCLSFEQAVLGPQILPWRSGDADERYFVAPLPLNAGQTCMRPSGTPAAIRQLDHTEFSDDHSEQQPPHLREFSKCSLFRNNEEANPGPTLFRPEG